MMNEDKSVSKGGLAPASLASRPGHFRGDRFWFNVVIVKIFLHHNLFRNKLRTWSIVNIDDVSKGVERKVL